MQTEQFVLDIIIDYQLLQKPLVFFSLSILHQSVQLIFNILL